MARFWGASEPCAAVIPTLPLIGARQRQSRVVPRRWNWLSAQHCRLSSQKMVIPVGLASPLARVWRRPPLHEGAALAEAERRATTRPMKDLR